MGANNIMHMNAGDGETSYSNNSALQRVIISKTLPVLDDTLEDMQMANPLLATMKCFKIVDLGCASGSNSLWAMAHILDKIEELCRQKHIKQVPEFEVYLNDLPDNDFNNLFKLFPNFCGGKNGKEKGQRFVYAVPGSFYGRLFARRTLHFAYSSNSLHWLSQVPEGLESNNKENIYLAMESSPTVFEAYSEQFHKDFTTFLSLRSEEIVQGGRMVLTFVGRTIEDPSTRDDCVYITLLAKSLMEMVTEGHVMLEDLYSFNWPFYAPCKQEVKFIIENEGSFTLDNVHDVCVPWDVSNNIDDKQEDPFFDKYKSGKLMADTIRAAVEPMMASHFGTSIINGIFERYSEKLADYLSRERSSYFTILISLTRK